MIKNYIKKRYVGYRVNFRPHSLQYWRFAPYIVFLISYMIILNIVLYYGLFIHYILTPYFIYIIYLNTNHIFIHHTDIISICNPKL